MRVESHGPVFVSRDPDARGYYGAYGGRFVPETLVAPIEELAEAYFKVRDEESFRTELGDLLRHYVGRPTPLYEAKRLSASAGGARIVLKREDLAHTGAHKINNALGQALLAVRMGSVALSRRPERGSTGWRPPPCARCWDSSATSTWAPTTWRGSRSTCSGCGCSARK
jgi:tryptophan synthase beta chain